jgi:hypothetical protein
MSFIFSRALVEACSQGRCSGTAASALLSGSPTPPLFLPSDKTTAFSRLSRFGMTFGHLTDDHGAELLTSWMAAFRARTYPLPARAQALTESALGCGPTWRGSLAKFDPDSCVWRTAQRSLLGDSDECSVTWPRSGMTADGLCWELPTLAPRISVTDSGLWPMPVASDTSSRTKPYAQGGTPLSLAVKWPPPTVCGNYNRKGASATSGDGLATAVRMFHTPTTNGLDGGSNSRKAAKKRGEETPSGGALNPTWVEWLMGWPLGWTDLKPLGTDKFPPAPLKHGEC